MINNNVAFDLIEDKLNPIIAKELVQSYYKKSINHFKLQKLKTWVGDHNANTSYYDELICDLFIQKKEAIETINTAITTGCNIQFNGKFNVNLIV